MGTLIEQLELADSMDRVGTLSKLPGLNAWEERELADLLGEIHEHVRAGGRLPGKWLSAHA